MLIPINSYEDLPHKPCAMFPPNNEILVIRECVRLFGKTPATIYTHKSGWFVELTPAEYAANTASIAVWIPEEKGNGL